MIGLHHNIAAVLLPGEEWKQDILKDYLLGEINCDLLMLEMNFKSVLNKK